MKIQKQENFKCIKILTIYCILMFCFSLALRSQWFAKFGPENHHFISGTTLISAKNWYREGIWNLKFSKVRDPKSIEKSKLADRELHFSYPSGFVIPIFILGKVFNKEPNPKILMAYNLMNHFSVALIMGIFTLFILLRLNIRANIAILTSTISINLVFFLRGPFYLFQNIYFADMAIMLPIAILFLNEILRDIYTAWKYNVYSKYLFIFASFYSSITDYFIFFVLITIYIKRIWLKDINLSKNFFKNSFIFWLGPILGISLLAIQHTALGTWEAIFNKAVYRMGIKSLEQIKGTQLVPDKNFLDYWEWFHHSIVNYIKAAFNKGGYIVIIISIFLWIYELIYNFFNKRLTASKSYLTLIMSLVSLPCLLQIYTLSHHSAIHWFSILKFIFILTLAFIYIPIHISQYSFFKTIINIIFEKISILKKYNITVREKFLLISFFISISLISYELISKRIYIHFEGAFPKEEKNIHILYEWVGNNTDYNDIIFSNFLSLTNTPPWKISLTMKRIYKIQNIKDMKSFYSFFKKISSKILPDQQWTLNFLIREKIKGTSDTLPKYLNVFKKESTLKGFIEIPSLNYKYFLYEIDKEKFKKTLLNNNLTTNNSKKATS